MLYSKNNRYNSLKTNLLQIEFFGNLRRKNGYLRIKNGCITKEKRLFTIILRRKNGCLRSRLFFFVNEKKTLSLQFNLNVK